MIRWFALVPRLRCRMPCRLPAMWLASASLLLAMSSAAQDFPPPLDTIGRPTPATAAPAAPLPSAVQAAPGRGRSPDPATPNAATSLATPAAPITEVREVRDPLRLARPIDLTTAPDDLWDRIRQGFSMPNLDSPLVTDRQIWYAARPSSLKRMVERSKRYLYHIVEELEKRGMPTELALLPMVESAFNPMAYSRAHAAGLWQFIPGTGKRYDLAQNWWYDGRRDIIAATSAALDYLRDVYDMHGDWHLALASYNWGENAVARAIERNRARGLPTDYLSLTMPAETRYYVPKLQALKNIISNPAAFGFDLDPIPNEPYFVTVEKTRDIDLRLAARLAEMPVEELVALNPAHNRPVISSTQTSALVLPADRVAVFEANLAAHDKPLTNWQTYTLKKTDRLEKLAAEHGITLARLRQVNGITARARIGPGSQILVPVKGSGAGAEPVLAMFQPPPVPDRAVTGQSGQQKQRTVRSIHVVQRGETLASIAQKHDVGIDDLRRWNSIGRLMSGQKLTIEKQVTVTVRKSAPAVRRPGRPAAKPRAKPKPPRKTAG